MPKIKLPGEDHERVLFLKVSQARALQEKFDVSFKLDDEKSIIQMLFNEGKMFAMQVAEFVLGVKEEQLDEVDSNVLYQFVEDLIVDFLPPLNQKAIRAQMKRMMQQAEELDLTSLETP